MKLKNIKLRYFFLPSIAFIVALWFVPTQAHMAVGPEIEVMEMRSLSPDGEEPQVVHFETEEFSWQKWITWIVATGNGLLGTAVQIKRIKDKK